MSSHFMSKKLYDRLRKDRARSPMKKKSKVHILGDLSPKDVYEYVDKNKNWNRNRYAVLDQNCYSFGGQHKDGYKFVVDITTGKICHHRKNLAIFFAHEKKEEVVMDHFIGWKFGVPIKIYTKYQRDVVSKDVRLVFEDESVFTVLVGGGGYTVCDKANYYYELIPHAAYRGAQHPRYPVCKGTKKNVAYCNSIDKMPEFGCTDNIEPIPVVTVMIDGRTIELSAETICELKDKLGV